jgi:hypothetical protein
MPQDALDDGRLVKEGDQAKAPSVTAGTPRRVQESVQLTAKVLDRYHVDAVTKRI